MVTIASESGEEKEFALYMQEQFRKLRIKCWIDKYTNLYAEVSGNGKPLLMNTHMDTVPPGKNIRPVINNNYIYSDGTTVLGADSKAGIAAFLELAIHIKEKNIPHRPFVVCLSGKEEVGIPTANYIRSDIQECIEPDRGTPLGEIITEAPFAQVYEIIIKGKTAYATTSYKKGKHTIMAAAELLHTLELGDIDEDTTANIGMIHGGRVTSMVPELCVLKGNCYSFSKSSFDNFFSTLQRTIKKTDKAFGTQTSITMHEYFPGFSLSQNDPLAKLVYGAIKDANLRPKYKVYKAVTNANILNSLGIKTVLISTGVENQHTVKERISINSLTKLTEILKNCVC